MNSIQELCDSSLQSISDAVQQQNQDQLFPKGSLFASCAAVTGMQALRLHIMQKHSKVKLEDVEKEISLMNKFKKHSLHKDIHNIPIERIVYVPLTDAANKNK